MGVAMIAVAAGIAVAMKKVKLPIASKKES